ncbi:hypothetical protein C0995_007587 [Termitomyces sp. Mi166|nr:hypothetical protein C0995_007587 [Termitomyces sp. Mi166\
MSASIPPIAAQPQHGHIPIRIAVVQLNPKIGEVDANIARARELCFKLKPHSIDLLCFPEMAFTGYVFESAEAISPYLEEPRTGPSSLFCQEVAKHLGCYVAGGYPERLSEEERGTESQVDVATKDPHSLPSGRTEIPPLDDHASSEIDALTSTSILQTRTPVGANSAIIYGPSGEWVGGYRKTNLFETDRTWAKPGTGFNSFSLSLPPVSSTKNRDAPAPTSLKMTIGICMDLNPFPSRDQTSTVEWSYELADYCVQNQSHMLVLLNAWLYWGLDDGEDVEANGTSDNANHSSAEDEDEAVGAEADEPSWHTLRYWAARLRPLWERDRRRRRSNETLVSDSSEEEHDIEERKKTEETPPRKTIVVVCNRTGEENGVCMWLVLSYWLRTHSLVDCAGKTFAGSSAIFSMRAGSGRANLLDVMGKDEEGVRVWNLPVQNQFQ